MKYRGIFEYEYPTEHKSPVSIDVHLHGDCVKGKIIEWEYRPLEQNPTTMNDLAVEAPILHLEPDNCGNYVVQSFPVKLNITEIKKHQSDFSDLEQEPTTKNDLEVDWESYKDVDGNSLDDLILEVLQNNFDCGNTYGYKVADEIIGLLPSVTPQEPRKGHWCPQNDDYFDWYECSECGYGSEGEMQYSSEYDVRTNFCPNCGADMR